MKKESPFVELHARSAFSFLRGASSPEEVVIRAAELGMSHVALTDRDGLYGSARAYHKAKELGLRSIVGAELTMDGGGVLPVLVRTREGYQNLCRLLTRSKLGHAKGASRVLWEELEQYCGGLTALTGDEDGVLQQSLIRNSRDQTSRLVDRLVHLFGKDQVYLEVQRRLVENENLQVRRIQHLAQSKNLPLLASNAPLYARPEARMLQDAFTCLRHHTHLDEAGVFLAPNGEAYLKSGRQMEMLFADMPEAVQTAQRVIQDVDFDLEKLGYRFPTFPVPEGHDESSFLRQLTYDAAKHRFEAITSKVRAQLDRELALISKLGFSGYFLVIWDIVRWCEEQGILIQGRGSAANSAVCYCLRITNADPIAGKLLFERFLSEGRETWPDIDLDLPSGDRREKVIQEMYRRFAPYGAAMTANVITYRGRSAMREMGKVLNLQKDVIERFTDQYANGDFPNTLDMGEQLRRAGLPQHHPRFPALMMLCHLVKGIPRHLGQHSGGMVLCTAGLDTIVPLEPASMPNRIVVQWDKDDCEDLGIIKVDLLGLGMMAVLEETITLSCQRGQGREVELAKIPHDDARTFQMMQEADTIGVFQIESRAQMATLPRMKPTCFYDVVVEVAIIRPGPIVGNLVHPYLKRRKEKELNPNAEFDCIHPSFKDVLERTLGVPLFQEQMLQMAMLIADLNGGEAEELRRAMSFHRSDERMDKALVKLRRGMVAKNVSNHIQEQIVASIKSFALYGFPESHAISFAILAYASVWLKANRAVEFFVSLLNNQPMGFYSTATLVRDAKRHGLRILPVCVKHSLYVCTVVDDTTLRLGLNQLRGISRKTLINMVEARPQEGWKDMQDFLDHCSLAAEERRVLAKAGALNEWGYHRRSALWEVEGPTLTGDLLQCVEDIQPASLQAMTASERLEADYQTTRLTVGPHPMGLVRSKIPRITRAVDLQQKRHGQWVTLAGMVICRQRPGTANGHCFISLEDETGISNAFVPSKLFEQRRLVITQEPFLKIAGMLQSLDGVITVLAKTIQPFLYDAMQTRIQSHDFR